MAIISIWGDTTPAGTWQVATDGDPSIEVGNGFYPIAGSPLLGKPCVGAKVWVPAGQAGKTLRVNGRLSTTPFSEQTQGLQLSDPPIRTKDVLVTDNEAHWESVTWDTPFTFPLVPTLLAVSHQFVSNPTHYIAGAMGRTANTYMASLVDPTAKIFWSESFMDWDSLQYAGTFYRIGTGPTTVAPGLVSYGADFLIDDQSAANVPPVANAGADQSVANGAQVTLTGSASTDSDGSIASYAWAQTAGPAVTLSGAGANRTFTPTQTGTYTFSLTVADSAGATSSDSVTVTVTAGNVPPSANAGPDQTASTGAQVTLSGSGTDSDGSVSSYAWAQTSGPTVSLSGTGATRTFTPTEPGTYVFSLTVTDNAGASSTPDTVIVSVTAPGFSTVAQENNLPGHGQQFWLDGITSEAIPSFARSTYYLPGQTARFSVDCNKAFEAEIFRLGSYGGAGARRVAGPFAGTPATQPAATAIPGGNGAVTCQAWSQNVSWAIPANATPGWYEVLLRSDDKTLYGHVLFCVSDKLAKKPLLMVTGDATWHAAYNGYGGNNVYGNEKGIASNSLSRALCSTYDKPVITKDYVPQTHFFNNSYPVLKFLEMAGYEVAQTTIEQIKNDPTILDGRELIMWTGHNEYIPQNVVTKTKQLLAAGQNMVNIAGNDFFWRVKFTDGAFTSNADGRVMWCKKDTMPGPTSGPDAAPGHVAGTPFTTAADWTGTWQDTRWSLREPSSEYLGDQFIANGIRADSVTVPASMKTSPAWRACPGIQALAAGQSYSFVAGSLGMEWDKPVSVSGGPVQVAFSSTTVNLAGVAADENGQNYNASDVATHAFTMGTNGKGALIANFNSDQWGWALDSLHLRGSAAADQNARQMMLNVIADLGVNPNPQSLQGTPLVAPTPVAEPFSAYGLPAPQTDPGTPGTPSGSETARRLRELGYETGVVVRL